MTEQQFLNFSPGSWFQTPRTLLQTLGLAEGVVLCYMWDMARYHKTTTIYMDNEEGAAKRIGIPSRKVWSAIVQRLVDKGMITRVRKGVPARYYYTLNHQNIVELFNKDMSPEEHADVTNRNNLLYPNVTSSCTPEGQLSKQTKKQTKQTNIEDKSSVTPNHWKEFDEYIGGPFFKLYPKHGRRNLMFASLDSMKKERSDIDTVEKVKEYLEQFKKGLEAYLKSVENPKFLMAPQNFIASRQWEQKTPPLNPSGLVEKEFNYDDISIDDLVAEQMKRVNKNKNN